MDADGQAYEALRQQNIRENAEFLLSLFEDQETMKLGPPPEQKKATTNRKRRSPSVSDTKDFEPARKSSRLATGSRRSLREKDLLPSMTRDRVKKEKKVRQGSRKSSRASGSRGRYTDWKSDEDDDSDAYVPTWRGRSGSRDQGRGSDNDDDDDDRRHSRAFDLSGRPILKKLTNPIAPVLPTSGGDEIYEERQPLPGRQVLPEGTGKGALIFEDYPQFAPNVTPEEMFRGGAFGCTAFRDYHSRVLQRPIDVEAELAELPQTWLESMDVELMLRSSYPEISRNKFKVKAGQALEDWEKNGWIRPLDPRGWFQWYYRFYLGRRSADDPRQISRWLKACGPAGRFRKALAQNITGRGGTWDDASVNSVVRQTLWQWGYELTEADYRAYFPL